MSEPPDPIDRRLVVVGDRVLVEPDRGDDRTEVGLYLPRWAVEKEKVQAGRIVACGPGIPLPDPGVMEDEPWRTSEAPSRHVPMQARIGDYAIFLRKASVEVKFEGRTYLIVPQGAILLLDRNPGGPSIRSLLAGEDEPDDEDPYDVDDAEDDEPEPGLE